MLAHNRFLGRPFLYRMVRNTNLKVHLGVCVSLSVRNVISNVCHLIMYEMAFTCDDRTHLWYGFRCTGGTLSKLGCDPPVLA